MEDSTCVMGVGIKFTEDEELHNKLYKLYSDNFTGKYEKRNYTYNNKDCEHSGVVILKLPEEYFPDYEILVFGEKCYQRFNAYDKNQEIILVTPTDILNETEVVVNFLTKHNIKFYRSNIKYIAQPYVR